MQNKNNKIICHDIENREYEIDSSKLAFRPSAYGIIINNGKILLSKQWDGYDFPGGGVEIHETVEDAVRREVWEETGLEVEVGEIVFVKSSFFKTSKAEKYFNCLLMYFLCEQVGGKLSKDNFDEEEKEYADMPEWVDLKDVDKIKFYNSVDSLALIKKALQVKEFYSKTKGNKFYE